jgi:hypothetical protein
MAGMLVAVSRGLHRRHQRRMGNLVLDGAADHGLVLVAAQVTRDDLAAAAAAELLDQGADNRHRQGSLVIGNCDGLGDGVRLRSLDAGVPS